MRFIANVSANKEGVLRLMIHETEYGVYLFGFNRIPDGGTMWDQWYESLNDAKEIAQEKYQLMPEAWVQLDEPYEHCQQDWIQPVRLKGRNLGQPEWGKLEHLVSGRWLDFDPEE